MRLLDTLSGEKKQLDPLDSTGGVRMYVCGLTPYSRAHVGHALKAVVFDVLRRFLEWRGSRVRHIENFTDVDDKLIERANALGVSVAELAEEHIDEYMRSLHKLNVLPATAYPRVTEFIPQIVEFIEQLVARGYAYVAGGDVYFRVRSFSGYGKLSHRRIDELKAGARVDPLERKDDPLDFALWKGAKPGEPSWPSPWGPGRPGWHIECSVMAYHTLGDQLDIHGGGADLIFPHHENEIAQTEALTGKPFAAIWVHNALLQMSGEKMSKSVGNVVPIAEALDRWGSDAFRLFVLTSHYRTPATFSEEAMEAARTGAERLREAALAPTRSGEALPLPLEELRQRFIAAMEDDLNTPRALAVLFELARDINRGRNEGHDTAAAQGLLRELAEVLGFTLQEPPQRQRAAAPFIDLLVEIRSELRSQKQFALADRIRARLGELGVELHDTPEGTTWRER